MKKFLVFLILLCSLSVVAQSKYDIIEEYGVPDSVVNYNNILYFSDVIMGRFSLYTLFTFEGGNLKAISYLGLPEDFNTMLNGMEARYVGIYDAGVGFEAGNYYLIYKYRSKDNLGMLTILQK